MGKLLVGDILKNQMPPELKEKFLTQFNLTPADIIAVYTASRSPTVFCKPLSIPCTEPGRTLHTHTGIGQLQGIPQT